MLATKVALTDSQQAIADSIVESDSLRTTLGGLAGTGKTTLARYIYEEWTRQGFDVGVIAPTGKASMVLRSKGVPARTIHSAIYNYKGKFETLDGDIEIVFKDKQDGRFCDRLIVDESSMVTRRQLDDIELRGIPTLWVGDPGQLPPVKSVATNLLRRPTHLLREIHRQAADSPIIRFAYDLRHGAELAKPFPGINHVDCSGRGPVFVASKMLDRNVDRLIVKTNAQRVALNNAYRAITNRSGVLAEGDEIICVMNNKLLGVVNGELFRVLEVFASNSAWTEAHLESIDTGAKQWIRCWNDQFGQEKKLDSDEIDQEYMLADYAYAITCHKFQGSSTRHAGIVAKGYCGDDPRCWNYTAATRAEEDITVFC